MNVLSRRNYRERLFALDPEAPRPIGWVTPTQVPLGRFRQWRLVRRLRRDIERAGATPSHLVRTPAGVFASLLFHNEAGTQYDLPGQVSTHNKLVQARGEMDDLT